MHAELAISFGKGARHGSKNAEVDILAEALNTLSERVHHAQKAGSTPDLDVVEVLESMRVTPGECANTAAVKGAHDWVTVEDQKDVAEVVDLDGVEDMTEFLNKTCDGEVYKNVSDDEKDEDEDDSGGRAVPPPYAKLSFQHFRALESVAEKCGMKEAAHHLQKAKMAMTHAHVSRLARQIDIRAFAAATERDDGEWDGSGSVS